MLRLQKGYGKKFMTRISDILEFFEGFAPVGTAMDFDNAGLLVGDKNCVVDKVLVTLDITGEVVCEAERLGCGLIISHHPVIFNPIKRLDTQSAVYMLANKGISAICMHTNLDLSEIFSVNICLAKALGVKDIRKSEKGVCMFTGELENPTDIYDFARSVKNNLGCEGLRFTDTKKTVKTVAVSSGAGGDDIAAAAEEGADVFVTGEIKHHEINLANELNVSIIDVGHYKSEDIVILPLVKKLSENFPDIIFTKSKAYTDNIKFI